MGKLDDKYTVSQDFEAIQENRAKKFFGWDKRILIERVRSTGERAFQSLGSLIK